MLNILDRIEGKTESINNSIDDILYHLSNNASIDENYIRFELTNIRDNVDSIYCEAEKEEEIIDYKDSLLSLYRVVREKLTEEDKLDIHLTSNLDLHELESLYWEEVYGNIITK